MSAITPAASVLLSRGHGSREIYTILRGSHLRFFGGFWAFPGGKLSEFDAELPADHPEAHLHSRRIAACRELFEETGILIARRVDGSFPEITPELDRYRQQLLDEQTSFTEMLKELGLTIRAGDFARIGEITTPAFAAIRFATTFFTAHVPPGQTPVIWPGELDHGEWVDTAEMLARWHRGEAWLTPPTAMTLQTLGDRPVEDAPRLLGPLFEHLSSGAEHPIFFAPTVQMIPLRTAALAPSTHTNAFLVGSGPRYLLDPGADDVVEQKRLFSILDERIASGQALTAVVLSHHHPDHIGAASACAQRYGIPIWAHPITAQRLDGRIKIDRRLNEGDRLDLGPCPANGGAWSLEPLHTPGHASGHLVFRDSFYGLLFAGDMVSTLSSIVIAPPDGDLAIYLHSLHRLRGLGARMLLPAHGNVSLKPAEVIDGALEHRAKREAQLLATLAEGPQTIEEMTERMYRGTPEALMRFARAQVLAGLLKLQAEGRARPVDDKRWRA